LAALELFLADLEALMGTLCGFADNSYHFLYMDVRFSSFFAEKRRFLPFVCKFRRLYQQFGRLLGASHHFFVYQQPSLIILKRIGVSYIFSWFEGCPGQFCRFRTPLPFFCTLSSILYQFSQSWRLSLPLFVDLQAILSIFVDLYALLITFLAYFVLLWALFADLGMFLTTFRTFSAVPYHS
jgi:hypothetical protein